MALFRKTTKRIKDLSILGADLHNHVLPGLDDGSPSLEESLKMLQTWIDLGYKKVITTPHVIHALYPNTKERILGQMYHLRQAIEENNLPIELEASAEYHLDFEFSIKMEKEEIIPFGNKRFILVELPFQEPSFSYTEILFDLTMSGYEPILAHPERYTYLSSRPDTFSELKDRGLLFQINMNSLTGLYGKLAQKSAISLIKENLVDFVGSDAHHNTHLLDLKKLFGNPHFIYLLESGRLRNSELL